MSYRILDEELSPEFRPKTTKQKTLDYQALTHFIISKFPIKKTEYILKAVEILRKSPNYEDQFSPYVSKLSNDDIELLFEGIKTSTTYK